jgi:hypothetical protein
VLVLDSTSCLFSVRGVILRASLVDNPNVNAKLGDESASIAMVFNPRSAKPYAKPPVMRVLPTPPFPETAIFIRNTTPQIFCIRVYLHFSKDCKERNIALP